METGMDTSNSKQSPREASLRAYSRARYGGAIYRDGRGGPLATTDGHALIVPGCVSLADAALAVKLGSAEDGLPGTEQVAGLLRSAGFEPRHRESPRVVVATTEPDPGPYAAALERRLTAIALAEAALARATARAASPGQRAVKQRELRGRERELREASRPIVGTIVVGEVAVSLPLLQRVRRAMGARQLALYPIVGGTPYDAILAEGTRGEGVALVMGMRT